MEDIVDDNGSVRVENVVRVLEQSSSFAVLLKNWKQFSFNLDVKHSKILDLQGKVNRETLQLEDLPREILQIWKAEKGYTATLENLNRALVKCKASDIAELLLTKLLTPQSVRQLKFLWQKKVVTLEKLLGEKISSSIYARICMEIKKNFDFQPLHLLGQKSVPPVQPKYYVNRTLLYTTLAELSSDIFISQAAQNHVFLLKNISRAELAKATSYQAIETSGAQLENVTVRFILLQCDEDFDRICKITSKPVHMLQYIKKRFMWIKSNTCLDTIRQFCKGENQPIGEPEIASRILSISPPLFLSISDTPGMGKTLLLANVATQVLQKSPSNTIVLYIVLQEFVKDILRVLSWKTALKAVAAHASSNEISKLILLEMLRSPANQLLLFLDGYDEVMQERLVDVDKFLGYLKEVKHVKVIMTTRPHLRTRLENIFLQFSSEIQPFDESNQIEFLTSYWADQYEARKCKALDDFSRRCLESLKTKLTDYEKEIAGIPLQCMMLAEVYAEDAERASNMNSLDNEPPNTISSFYQMYKRLVDLKLQRILKLQTKSKRKRLVKLLTSSDMTQHYLNAHVHYAIALLFPRWVDNFFSILWGLGSFKVDKNILFSIGLVEKSQEEEAPRFIHRTFAEHILAGFIVDNLGKHYQCVNFLFSEMFGERGIFREEGITYGEEYYYLNLKYPALAYFIEMHIKEYVKNHGFKKILPDKWSRLFHAPKFNDEDAKKTIVACCSHDLENLFDYELKLSQYCIALKMEYFRDSSFAVIERSKNIIMLEKLLKIAFESDIDFNECTKVDRKIGLWLIVPKYTIVHAAVLVGKYNMASVLLNKFRSQLEDLQYLLHACVCESSANSRSVIEDKLLIIDMLVKINRGWLDERDQRDCTPIIQQNVHLKLLQRLLLHGADINAYSSRKGTILKPEGDKDRYMEVARWALSNGFKLVNREDETKRTPLMQAIIEFDTVDMEVLKLFHLAGADFNARDKFGRSVIFTALDYSGNEQLIKKLIELGADENQINLWKEQNAPQKQKAQANAQVVSSRNFDDVKDSLWGLIVTISFSLVFVSLIMIVDKLLSI